MSMATEGIDSAKISNEIEALVFDRLQVVSYKWLSRNFSVPSNSAKRLLQEFVEQHRDGLEVIYAISGWSKAEPGCYSVRLIPKAKLEEVKAEFKVNCSVHIYSVQSCLPKDPAELWGAEFVQTEELFNQSSSVNNCLWDNRFSAVSYPLVKRNLNGKNTRIIPPVSQPRLASTSASASASASAPAAVNGLPKQNVSPPQVQVPLTSDTSAARVPKVEPHSSVSAADVKEALAGKSINASTAVTNKKKGQNGKASEGALASLWGRASSKPKPSSPPPLGDHVNADAQINAWEAAGNSSNEDEEDFFRLRRVQSTNGSGRKRRVVFEMSDDENEEDVIGSKPAVSLASPELPKQTSGVKDEFKTLDNKDAGQENKDVKVQGKAKTKVASARKSTVSSKSTKEVQFEKTHDQMKGKVNNSADNNANPMSHLEEKKNSPDKAAVNETKTCETERIPSNDACVSKAGVKKRKILKTHIDDRGREVTEVTWEVDGVEPEKAKDVSDQAKKSCVLGNADNKPKATGKGPSVDHSRSANPTSKPNGKHTQKGAGKDTRQGNILSFFKKS